MDCSCVRLVARQSSACSVQRMLHEAEGISLAVFAELLGSTKSVKVVSYKIHKTNIMQLCESPVQ